MKWVFPIDPMIAIESVPVIRCSCFNVPFSGGGIHAVWNSRSGCTVALPEKEFYALKDNRVDEIGASTCDFLLKKGILVDEPYELRHFLEERHAGRQLRSLHFRILTTTACNARCGYCYEHNFPLKTMGTNTALSVAAFILERYKEHPTGRTVTLEWFGGEPTLNLPVIDIITERLRMEGIPFRSAMSTNGILLSEAVRANADKWNLQDVQITLDAAGERYEAIKHVPQGGFARVLENIDHCMQAGIRVSVRINDCGDQESVKQLLHILADRYAASAGKPYVYITPLYGGERSIGAETMKEVMALNNLLIQLGLMRFEEVYRLSQRDRCFAATPWGFTVMPDGTLVNCSHNASAGNSYGTISDYDLDNELHGKFLSDALTADCYECALLPICGGGCSAAQYGIAEMHQCIPYRNTITDILRNTLAAETN